MDPRFVQLSEALQQHPGRQLHLPGLELRDSAVHAGTKAAAAIRTKSERK